MPRDLRMFLHDIVQSCRAIQDYTAGLTLDDYRESRQLRASVERELIIIGEALRRAIRLDQALGQQIDQASVIIAFRNNLVHQYEVVDDEIVWNVIVNDLPVLERQVCDLLDQLNQG